MYLNTIIIEGKLASAIYVVAGVASFDLDIGQKAPISIEDPLPTESLLDSPPGREMRIAGRVEVSVPTYSAKPELYIVAQNTELKPIFTNRYPAPTRETL